MFETMAVLTTLALIAIFVILVRIDRSGRREEEATAEQQPPTNGQ